MAARQERTKETQLEGIIKLPSLLKRYQDADFSTQIKVRFLFYLYLVCLVAVSIHFTLSLGTLWFNEEALTLTHIKLISEAATIVLTVSFFQILLRGRYSLAAHLLIITLQIHVWIALMVQEKEAALQFNAIVHLMSILATIPIIMEKQRKTILIYFASNILMVGYATLYFKEKLNLSDQGQIQFFFTTAVAIGFLGYVSYNIFIINQRSLQQAKEELHERKAVEEALAASEKKYREMADLLPQSIFEIKSDGTLLYVNKASIRMFGYSEEDMINGFNFLNIIIPEERELMRKNTRSFLQTAKNSNHQYTALRKDGSNFPIQFSSSIIYEKDEIIGLRGVGIDVTEQKKAEAAIRESLQLFQTLIEFAPTPVFLSNAKGHFLMINKAFCEQTGYSYEDITLDTGIRTSTLIPHHYWPTINNLLMEKNQVENLEIKTTRRDQTTLDLLYYCKKLIIKGREVYLSTFTDITEKKKIEVELEYYSDQLEHLVIERTEELAVSIEELRISNENLNIQRAELEQALQELKNTEKQLMLADKMASLGLLAAGIAHEINNPLNFIKGGIYGLETFFHENLPNEKQEEAFPLIMAIDKGIDRAADIVRSLNRFSRQTENRSESCDLHAIIEDCLILMESQMKNRIQITKQLEAGYHTFIYNEGRINQAILNLLTNAAQAIENQGKINIRTKNQKKLLILSIHDDGCGIEQQHLNRIFDPFFTTKEPGKGTGLGLSITFQIIKEINGTIEYNSEPGKGTKVSVKIPINTADNDE
ncbi:MAG: PAS domain-containing sensor histidine kinase [Breznakibacter sp.]